MLDYPLGLNVPVVLGYKDGDVKPGFRGMMGYASAYPALPMTLAL